MKRGIAAILIVVCVGAAALATNSCMEKQAHELIETAQSTFDGKTEFSELYEKWNNVNTFFSFFIGHNRLEAVSSNLEQIKYEEAEERQESLAEIIAQLKGLKEHISVSLYNIF